MPKTTALFFPLACLLLCFPIPAQQVTTDAPAEAVPIIEVATLGLTTRGPKKDELKKLGLKFEVRARGQIVTALEDDGAAAKAGIAIGDVIVKLGEVEVFSRDDIADLVRVSAPGQKIDVTIERAESHQQEVVSVTLGTEEIAAPESPRLEWQYASLANLNAALAVAKKRGVPVLVGLSGAET